MAVQELSALVEQSDGPNLMGFCPPKEGTRWQLVQVFERYADNHPGQLHLTFGEVVVMALFEALPQKMKGTLLVELSGCALITRSVRAARRSSLSLAVGKSATSADYPTRAERQKK
jgi:hypothetical protein